MKAPGFPRVTLEDMVCGPVVLTTEQDPPARRAGLRGPRQHGGRAQNARASRGPAGRAAPGHWAGDREAQQDSDLCHPNAWLQPESGPSWAHT